MDEATCIQKKSTDKRKYYQSRDGQKWYSKDRAGHGGPQTKVYWNIGQTLELEGSLDWKGNWMEGKHESGKYQTIYEKKTVS